MSFDAILFEPVTRNSTKVSVRAFGSSLEVIGGPETLRVDSARCQLTAGGWDRESIQITWSGEGGLFALSSTDPKAAAEIGRIPQFSKALDAATKAQKGARRSGRLGLAIVGFIAALPLIAILLLLAFRDPIIDFVLERIPVTVDQEVGKMFEGEFLGSKDVVADNDATRAVGLIVDKLKAAAPEKRFEFKVSVQKNKEINAFAAPGGLIVVYTGLIAEAGSAEEVAGVLAHEMAHATRRHSMRQMIYAGGLLPLAGLLMGSPDAASLFQGLGQLTDLKFSRSQEEDADLTGFDTLVAAGISTEGMARFFDRLAATSGAPPSFLSTHPSSTDRAAAIRARTKALPNPAPEPLAIDWEAVKTSIR